MTASAGTANKTQTGPSINPGNIYTIALQTLMASIANGDLMTTFKPGHTFAIRRVDFVQNVAVTAGSKAATLTTYINTVACTGGVLALTSALCTPIGVCIAATAMDTQVAKNQGSATDTITLTWSSVTAFTEGSGTILLTIENCDVLL
jgi:hypothetical protein